MENLQPIIQLHTLLGNSAAHVESGLVSRPYNNDGLVRAYIWYLLEQPQDIFITGYATAEEAGPSTHYFHHIIPGDRKVSCRSMDLTHLPIQGLIQPCYCNCPMWSSQCHLFWWKWLPKSYLQPQYQIGDDKQCWYKDYWHWFLFYHLIIACWDSVIRTLTLQAQHQRNHLGTSVTHR